MSYQEADCQFVEISILVGENASGPLVVVIVNKHQSVKSVRKPLQIDYVTEVFALKNNVHFNLVLTLPKFFSPLKFWFWSLIQLLSQSPALKHQIKVALLFIQPKNYVLQTRIVPELSNLSD